METSDDFNNFYDVQPSQFNTAAVRQLSDADRPYRFGQPVTYLNTREHARLTILRARLDSLGKMNRREQAKTIEFGNADLSQAGRD